MVGFFWGGGWLVGCRPPLPPSAPEVSEVTNLSTEVSEVTTCRRGEVGHRGRWGGVCAPHPGGGRVNTHPLPAAWGGGVPPSVAVTTLLGEWLCMRRELQEISLTGVDGFT